jgi:hypothetical protein
MNNQFDMVCPECGSSAHLDVAALVWVRLTADGTDPDEAHDGGHEWDDDSPCRCDNCDWTGTVLGASPDETDGQEVPAQGATIPLPPDPEGKNDARAEWADKAIRAFARATKMDTAGEDEETALGDLLANMMHWCDRKGISFSEAVTRAMDHYTEETAAN